MSQELARQGYVEVRNLVKRYGSLTVVAEVSFAVNRGEVLALLGPSGCGKTTILRCIAGLEVPDGGIIRIGEMVVNDAARRLHVNPESREIGMVFQSYAVWPHMTVFENVAFPLRVRRVPAGEIRERVNQALELVGLDGLNERPASMLSGGQQQRVALARALVSNPRVVLFDEPLSNLDARLRERMRFELANLQQRIGFTAIYVTHDQEEALGLAQKLVVLREGKVEQEGSPEEIFREPANSFVAEFLGFSNAIPGKVVGEGNRPSTIEVELEEGLGTMEVRSRGRLPRGREVIVAFRPEHVLLCREPMPGYNCIPAHVESAFYLGYCIDYSLRVGKQVLRVRGMSNQVPAEDELVYACINPDACCAVIP